MGEKKIEAATGEAEYVRYEYLQKRFGVTKMTIWRWMRREVNPLPKPYRISNKSVVWKKSEIDAWADRQ